MLLPVFVARRDSVPAGDEALKSGDCSDTFGERARPGAPTADRRLRALEIEQGKGRASRVVAAKTAIKRGSANRR